MAQPQRQNKYHDPSLLKFAIYPDYWMKKWGQKPLLGFVYAKDEFHAERKAYDKGILRKNVTFSSVAKLADESDVYNTRYSKKRKFKEGRLPMRRPPF